MEKKPIVLQDVKIKVWGNSMQALAIATPLNGKLLKGMHQ
jgi:hypothetical protein